MQRILGVSAYCHYGAAALLSDGRIVAAAQEERFSRIKHDAGFPSHATRYCLEEANLRLTDLDAVVFHDEPLLKFERLLETYLAFAPKGFSSFVIAMPVWLKDKLLRRLFGRDAMQRGSDSTVTTYRTPSQERHANDMEHPF